MWGARRLELRIACKAAARAAEVKLQAAGTVGLDLARLALPLASMRLRGVQMLPVAKWPPQWLVVGGTSHWSAMSPFHSEGLGCARCLHNMATVDSVVFSFGLH